MLSKGKKQKLPLKCFPASIWFLKSGSLTLKPLKICFNASSAAVFASLPEKVRWAITDCQLRIESEVLSKVVGAVATSGFRCASYNSRLPASIPDSRHLWGAARDYAIDGFPLGVSVSEGFRIIYEKHCVHVELK